MLALLIKGESIVEKIKAMSLTSKLILLNLTSLLFIFGLVYFYVFPAVEKIVIESYKEKVRNAVEIAHDILNEAHSRVIKGEVSEEEAKKQAINTIKAIRYNETEYFWIHNLDLKLVAHPLFPEQENTDVTDKTDINGFALYVEMNKIVNASGSGFVRYMWPKPVTKEIVEKYAYAKLFKPWGWVPGNGIYFDQIYGTISNLQFAVYGGLGFAAFLSCLLTTLFAHKLSNNLKAALERLNFVGEELSSVSNSLSETGKNVSEGVSQSSSSLTQTSASMEEISLMSKKNSDSSRETHTYASQCLQATQKGMEIVNQVKSCMQEISKSNTDVMTQNEQSAKHISEIVNVIQGIAEKTKIINDIVFQTKLLSFNASVEAARAGEAGKGFAVVAEEVGSLAAMSGAAAKDIENSLAESIKNVESIIKEDVSASLKMVEMSVNKVKEGVTVVEDCEKVFDEIMTQVTHVTDLANQISSSCREQDIGFEEAKKAILQLEGTSQKNAKASEEVASSVEQMVEQVSKVQNQSQFIFKLIDGEKKAA